MDNFILLCLLFKKKRFLYIERETGSKTPLGMLLAPFKYFLWLLAQRQKSCLCARFLPYVQLVSSGMGTWPFSSLDKKAPRHHSTGLWTQCSLGLGRDASALYPNNSHTPFRSQPEHCFFTMPFMAWTGITKIFLSF